MNNYISNSLSVPYYFPILHTSFSGRENHDLFQSTFPIFPSFFKIPRIIWASPFPTSITITICCIVRLPVSLLVWGCEDFPGSVETKSWDLQRTARHEWNLNKNAAAHRGVTRRATVSSLQEDCNLRIHWDNIPPSMAAMFNKSYIFFYVHSNKIDSHMSL